MIPSRCRQTQLTFLNLATSLCVSCLLHNTVCSLSCLKVMSYSVLIRRFPSTTCRHGVDSQACVGSLSRLLVLQMPTPSVALFAHIREQEQTDGGCWSSVALVQHDSAAQWAHVRVCSLPALRKGKRGCTLQKHVALAQAWGQAREAAVSMCQHLLACRLGSAHLDSKELVQITQFCAEAKMGTVLWTERLSDLLKMQC